MELRFVYSPFFALKVHEDENCSISIDSGSNTTLVELKKIGVLVIADKDLILTNYSEATETTLKYLFNKMSVTQFVEFIQAFAKERFQTGLNAGWPTEDYW